MVETIWNQFLTIVKEEVGSRVVETWFKAISLCQWDSINNTVFLQAPNTFVKNWIENKYKDLIKIHLGRLLHVKTLKIIFLDNKADKHLKNSDTFANVDFVPAVIDRKKNTVTTANKFKTYGPINKTYQFETFIVGPNNSLARAAAEAVTDNPGKLYNPLFIYGDSGLGKTHLLHAIGNCIRAKHKDLTVLYQTADRFVNEFISAIRFNKMHRFQSKYNKVDVLLIDDIQFISNKEQTQEAFFHIFNTLYDSHKQIVFSSDTFPQNINGIADRLKSRLAWGLVADIYAPSIEIKIAILKKKADAHGINLDTVIATFIASRINSNIRELEGALIRIVAFASLTKQDITLELAQKVLLQSLNSKTQIVNFNRVVKCISRHYPYDLESLRSKKRNKNLSFSRHLAMFLMKEVTNKSFRDIGKYLGGRDHSTVMHAVNKIEKYLLNNPSFSEQVRKMKKEIYT